MILIQSVRAKDKYGITRNLHFKLGKTRRENKIRQRNLSHRIAKVEQTEKNNREASRETYNLFFKPWIIQRFSQK